MKSSSAVVWLLAALLLTPLSVPAANTPAAAPAPNWYGVEIIVFQNTDPQAGVLESWPANPGVPDWNGALALQPAGSNAAYPQLPPSSYRLDYYWRKLQRSSDYRPLLHLAWAQPAIDRASALFVRIGTPPTMPASAASASTAAASAAPSEAAGTVYGIAKLSTTGPYLHFDLDLLYCGPPAKNVIAAPPASSAPTEPTTADTLAATGAAASACQPYRLRQDRRLDAGKLNYFDQPMFGALVLVTPRPK